MLTKNYLSPSSARWFDKSPDHLLYYWNEPRNEEYNEAFAIGNAFEALMTGTFIQTIWEKPFPNKSVNLVANKESWAVAHANNAIKLADYNTALAMAANATVWKRGGETQKQVSVMLFGVEWRGVLDSINNGIVTEYKTMPSVSYDKFGRKVYDMLYYLQAYIYVKGMGAQKCEFVCAEKNKPYLAACYSMENWMEMAEVKCKELSERFLKWQDADFIKTGRYRATRNAISSVPEKWMK